MITYAGPTGISPLPVIKGVEKREKKKG